jgi:cysteinyl-tRNA synthetase
MSYSTHAGNSGVPTPPDLVSPSGARCGLDVQTIERLIEERNEARRVCNFREADRIRDLLKSHGIGLMDEPGARGKGKEVTSWRFGGRK